MGKKRILLENSVNLPFVWGEVGDVLAVKDNFSGIRSFKTAYNAQGGGFSTSAGA